MKLLILGWGAYTQSDVNETLLANHVTFKQVNYCFGDKNNDDFFYRHFTKYLTADSYDAVFTINYFPLVAKVCHDNHVKYLSWSYDNPLNVPDIEKTLGYDTNYVFLFDRIQAAFYQNKGYTNVYHLPLAVNPMRLGKLTLSPTEQQQFSSQISFVGKLYPSPFEDLIAPLSDYYQGYLKALIETQSKIYGYYYLDELLTPELLNTLNGEYHQKLNSAAFSITKEQLSYAMATYITRQERLLLLKLLANHYQVKLYSREIHPALSKVSFCGSAKYIAEMPKIFRASKINLNITLKILQCGMPLRVLDILGSGGFLLSNYQEELVENFIPDTDMVIYSDLGDAFDKAAFYLEHEDLRSQIAKNGCAKAFEEFNYTKQLKTMFETADILL